MNVLGVDDVEKAEKLLVGTLSNATAAGVDAGKNRLSAGASDNRSFWVLDFIKVGLG